MLELARNQKIQDKLREDILSTINELKKQQKSNSFKLEYKDLFKFNYLTLVINEGLRLWPVVALGTIVIFIFHNSSFSFSFSLSFYVSPNN